MEMERNDDGSAGMQNNGQVEQEGERSAKKLKGSIAVEAFSCGVCAHLLRPPIFQCSSGPGWHFICSSCRDKLPEPDKNKCPFCSGGALARSLGMERAARSILVDCRYAERGCTEKTAYCEQDSHEKVCPHAPCLCPAEPGCCGFAGSQDELLDHLTGHHGWPLTTFHYWVPFDLHVDEPGAQVLRCEEDGQLFLVHVAPPGQAVALVGVPPYRKPTGFGCRAEFSCFRSHRGTSALDDIQPLRRVSDWPPATEFLCVLPEVSYGENKPCVAPSTVSVMFVCASPNGGEKSWHDTSYLESDEEDDSD